MLWESSQEVNFSTTAVYILNTCIFVSSRYSSHLGDAQAFGIKKGVMSGLGMGFFQVVMFGSYALAFW